MRLTNITTHISPSWPPHQKHTSEKRNQNQKIFIFDQNLFNISNEEIIKLISVEKISTICE